MTVGYKELVEIWEKHLDQIELGEHKEYIKYRDITYKIENDELEFSKFERQCLEEMLNYLQTLISYKINSETITYRETLDELIEELNYCNSMLYYLEKQDYDNDYNKDNKENNIIVDRMKQMLEIQKEGLELFKRKNADYGDAFANYGPVGVIVRMGDKIQRLVSVTNNGVNLVNTESLRDTLIDLHNYSAMAIMLLDENK